MIVHLVMFELKDEFLASDELKIKTINEIKNKLLSMVGAINELKFLEVGVNFSKSERAMDISLYSKFECKDDLKKYQICDYHQEVLSFIKERIKLSKVVDYEI